MRVVSMVPSWTETLVEAGIDVVGRTRFCIHPNEKIRNIPIVGGTKNIDWEKLSTLKFDYLLLDREENPKDMASKTEVQSLVTHVRSCRDLPLELDILSAKLKSQELLSVANRWRKVLAKFSAEPVKQQLHRLPLNKQKALGLTEWIKKPANSYENLVYVIWKNPYMAVTADTFIGSILDLVGLPTSLTTEHCGKTYPEISIEKFNLATTLFLFSSEPFPFAKRKQDIIDLGVNAALVDGEKFSWFGLRSLKFLEEVLDLPT